MFLPPERWDPNCVPLFTLVSALITALLLRLTFPNRSSGLRAFACLGQTTAQDLPPWIAAPAAFTIPRFTRFLPLLVAPSAFLRRGIAPAARLVAGSRRHRFARCWLDYWTVCARFPRTPMPEPTTCPVVNIGPILRTFTTRNVPLHTHGPHDGRPQFNLHYRHLRTTPGLTLRYYRYCADYTTTPPRLLYGCCLPFGLVYVVTRTAFAPLLRSPLLPYPFVVPLLRITFTVLNAHVPHTAGSGHRCWFGSVPLTHVTARFTFWFYYRYHLTLHAGRPPSRFYWLVVAGRARHHFTAHAHRTHGSPLPPPQLTVPHIVPVWTPTHCYHPSWCATLYHPRLRWTTLPVYQTPTVGSGTLRWTPVTTPVHHPTPTITTRSRCSCRTYPRMPDADTFRLALPPVATFAFPILRLVLPHVGFDSPRYYRCVSSLPGYPHGACCYGPRDPCGPR